jgi:hypothetical protein
MNWFSWVKDEDDDNCFGDCNQVVTSHVQACSSLNCDPLFDINDPYKVWA